MLVPRDRLHKLLKSGADPWALTTVVMDTFREHPKNADVQRHLLQFMDKALDVHRPVNDPYGWAPTELVPWKIISISILTVAWNLGDIPLYCKAIRARTARGDVPDDLVAKLATLINKSPSIPQPSDWDKWYVFYVVWQLRSPLHFTNTSAPLLVSDGSWTALSILLVSSQR